MRRTVLILALPLTLATGTALGDEPTIEDDLAQRHAIEVQTIAVCEALAELPDVHDGDCATMATALDRLLDEHAEVLEHKAARHWESVGEACVDVLSEPWKVFDSCAESDPGFSEARERLRDVLAEGRPSRFFEGLLPGEEQAFVAFCGRVGEALVDHADDCEAAAAALAPLRDDPVAGLLSREVRDRATVRNDCTAAIGPQLDTVKRCYSRSEAFDEAMEAVLGDI